MNQLICNPGFLHITTKILSHLDNKTQLTCRLGKSITNLFGKPAYDRLWKMADPLFLDNIRPLLISLKTSQFDSGK